MRAEARTLAAEALQARAWALDVLAGSGRHRPLETQGAESPPTTSTTPIAADAAHPAAPPFPCGVSLRGWELFLRAERCALPLSRRLRLSGADRAIPPETVRLLDAIAIEELQRVLSARARLRRLSEWALERGTTAVVLKGAVAAADARQGIDLSDVDVWVPPAAAADLIDALAGARAESPEHRMMGHHYVPIATDQLVAVEVHDRVPHAELDDGWVDRSQPLGPEFPGLARLDPADHLWHILIHATVQHRARHGCLRDVFLIAHARSLCGAADLERVVARAKRHPSADPLLAMLDMAAIDGTGAHTDPFTTAAANRYLQALVRPPRRLSRLYVAEAAAAVLHGPRDVLRFIGTAYRQRHYPSTVPALRALQRLGRAGNAVVLVVRMAIHATAALLAANRVRTARRLARAHERS